MTELKNGNHFQLNQQADTIRGMGVAVAKRRTLFLRKELYAIDEVFVEISYLRYIRATVVDSIKPIRTSDSLKPYLNQITLPVQL